LESHTRVSPCAKHTARLRIDVHKYEQHRFHWLEESEVCKSAPLWWGQFIKLCNTLFLLDLCRFSHSSCCSLAEFTNFLLWMTSQAEFFLRFCNWCNAEQNGISIGLRSFQYLKPFYIRTLKDFNVCCCQYHVEIDMLKDAVNKFRKFQHCKEDCTCNCSACSSSTTESCVASRNLIKSVRVWMDGALCPKQEGMEFHLKNCILGTCPHCGVQKLEWCPVELDPAHEISIDWQSFERVELEEKAQLKRQKKAGTDESQTRPVKCLRLVQKRTSMAIFKAHVMNSMKNFLVHNFQYRWQAQQHDICMKSFPRGTIVSSIDFSENYSFKMQNEIQTQHWDNRQCTLLILVTYRHRADADCMEATVGRSVSLAQNEVGDRDIIADYHFFISDDNNHDTLMVQHCMDLHWNWMKDQGIRFNQHWV
jgi:hypothetical protein